MRRQSRALIGRILQILPTLLLIALAVFMLVRLLPGDPATALLGVHATPELIARIHQQLGLDQPIWVQFGYFVWSLLQGDLGMSLLRRVSVIRLIEDRLPVTLYLTGLSALISVVLAVPLAFVAALWRNQFADVAVRGVFQVGLSTPVFYLGLVLLGLFAARWHFLPVGGIGDNVFDTLYHLFLPAVTLGLSLAAGLMRNLRNGIIGVPRLGPPATGARRMNAPPRRLTAESAQHSGGASAGDVLLVVQDITKTFVVGGDGHARVHALSGVSLSMRRGETLGVVGESGCGKSTLARCLVRLHELDSGRIVYDGVEIGGLRGAARRAYNRRVQMVFQDPYGSLNPSMSVAATLAEPLRVHRLCPRSEIPARVAALLDLVHLPQAAAARLPHEFSGGQRQRIGIARALSVNPECQIADELVSALDVSVQAQMVNLLLELQERLGLTVVFIAHDLRLVRHLSHGSR